MRIRVLTWNIHKGIGGVDRRYRPERIIAVLDHYQPDIALLQEVDRNVKRSRHHHQVDHLADELDYPYRAYGPNVKVRTGVYGNATLARFPLRDVHNVDLTLKPKKRRGALFCRCHLERRGHTRTLGIFNLHLGLAGFERRIQLRRLMRHELMRGFRKSTPLLVGGDFNDLWGGLGPRLLAPEGFRRAGPLANTYPSFLPTRPLDGLHVRGTVKIRRGFRSRMKLARAASDHLPLIADLEVGVRG